DSEMDDAYRAVTVMRLLCKMLVGLGVSLSGLKIGGTQDDITMSAYEFYAVTARIQDLVVECNSEVGWHHFIEYRYWRNLRSLKVTVSSPEHIEDIAKFLIAQRSLETFKFTSNNINVDPQRILRALDKQGNSLRYLTIKNTSLSRCMPLYTIAGLKRLQSLRFENVSGVNATIIRPLLNAKFPCMKRVRISGDETVCSEAHIWAQSFK
ncbi:3755_t:CDS:2, partial [Paraglomus occultum]